ncbi:MAG TPA: cytochrome b/b6 domain-containing protein [Alphaproteobacteria bacterium]|jgi:thiosulfate reductase cytochrome b subunit|nr:cytochrome b/b6 domain-containing protein [Alphaproteobacteria bacterium]
MTTALHSEGHVAGPGEPRGGSRVYRHSLIVRVTHWINVVCVTVLLMSGLQIFNAHPALYWGDRSQFDAPVLAIGADGGTGITTVFGHTFNTTGVLGLSGGFPGTRGFPAWATLPSEQWLAMGRRWHFFFAWLFVINGAVYLLYALFGGHIRRDLVPTRWDLRHIGRSIWDHVRLRFPKGEEAKRYNVLQKISYLVVLFVLLPILILAGLSMSPRIDAGYPWLPALFGGRQSARTIHFICAFTLLAFVAIHIVMVLLSGLWNNMRAMITGWYDIDRAREKARRP